MSSPRPKVGRPPRAGTPAGERIEIRVTSKERRSWKRSAGGTPLAEWLRSMANARTSRQEAQLPRHLRRLFWDVDFESVSWRKHFGYIVIRLLSVGGPKTVNWLRNKAGDDAIRTEVMSCKAMGLSCEQALPWISKEQYDAWLKDDTNRAIWTP